MFFTVRDSDKAEIADTAKKYHELGFALYATAGTAAVLRRRRHAGDGGGRKSMNRRTIP